jgi:mannosyl-3-phosphoglycerate phosphatase family protein
MLSPVIFTDMDGSLLDHYSYSHAAADKLLSSLSYDAIPVIMTTSKTYAELQPLRQSLNNKSPFIVENGAAIFIPKDYFPSPPEQCTSIENYWLHELSPPRQQWLDVIDNIRKNYIYEEHEKEFVQFSHLSNEQISQITGLNIDSAALAAQRQYGEPIQWLGTPKRQKEFIEQLQNNDAQALQGGRFLHVSGHCDKGRALQWLFSQYQKQYPNAEFTSVAIGDSQNDVAMLETADIALLIRSPVHQLPALTRSENVFTSTQYGPEGWSEGVETILDMLKINSN